MAAQRILLFGDQTDTPIPMIRRVLEKSRHSKNLQLFLQSAIDTIQLEVAKLTPAERDSLGSFHSVQDLTERYKTKQDRFGIAQMLLVYIARIGEFIAHAESNPSLLTEDNSSEILVLGICGGLLAAAAAAVARNLAELIEAASFLAGVTCRVAAAVSRRAVQIEDGTGSWAFSTVGNIVTQLAPILEQFHRVQSIPRHRQAYIAINANTWATVFGPPSVLKRLLNASAALRDSDISILPAFGAVHAAHLAIPDLVEVIGESLLLQRSMKHNCRLISGSKYAPFVCSNLRDLLEEIILDIFQRSTNPTRLFEVTGSFLNRAKEVSLFVLGSTAYLLPLRRSLDVQGIKVAVLTTAPSLQTPEPRGGSGLVAIIGMSGQFPGSKSVDELWDSIMRQEEFHKKIPADRFNLDAYLDETGQAKTAITAAYGCFLDHPGQFDYKMFNVSPREAMQMDPSQRMLLHATYEALEHAGVTTNGTLATDSRRIRTFIGAGSDDWRELQQTFGVDKYIVQGTQRAFTPGRLHHHFKWEGATFSVDSACASTASAVGMAYTALVDRDCDTAIAGGSNIIATPFWQSALSKGGFLSPTGRCKTFQEDADGYCRGEATGVIIMKRLEDAIQDNDNIISVIRAYARNHSAETVSITRPHIQTQERLYRCVLNKAGLQPHEISYVEMHGTGTIYGDSAELESVGNVFAPKGSRESPLIVGAIKANIGHSEAASGISSLIKAAMTFQKGVIPPQVGIPQNLRKFTCLDKSTILIPGCPVPFSYQAGGRKRNIVVNNFDAAGGNSCFVLEEPPVPRDTESDPRSYHIVTCSAHSPISLEQNKRRLLQYLVENSDTSLGNLAYTTTSRRIHHSLRSAYCGSSIQNIIDALAKDLNGGIHGPQRQRGTPPTVFVFTGQGAHYSGIGVDLFQTSPQFRSIITNLQRICITHGFPPWTQLISDPNLNIDTITTIQLHLGLVALQLALVDLWKTWGIEPDVVIGHSIGEYAALYAAGVLSAQDVMYLIGKRAELIQAKLTTGTHAMLSISGTPDKISAVLSKKYTGDYEISCINSPGMVVLSGERPEMLRLDDLLTERQFKCRLLDVPYAMHSSQMDAIMKEFRLLSRGVLFNKPRIKVVSTLLGDLVTEGTVFGNDYLARHTREPVQFEKAVANCISRQLADSNALWLEIGPNPVCLGLVRSNINVPSSNALTSFKKGENNWKTISAILATIYQANKLVRWHEYHREFLTSLSHIILPKYAFDTREFWVTFSDSPQRLEKNAMKVDEKRELQPISTSLHYLVKQKDNAQEQSAIFTSDLSRPSLLEAIQGHRLSGIAVCPAGVFFDMALTATRYLMTDGVSTAPFPSLSVLETQIDYPVVPAHDSHQTIQVGIHRQKNGANNFWVSFTNHTEPSSPAIAKCLVRIRDERAFEIEREALISSIKPKIIKLMKNSGTELVSRFQGKIFYKLFSHLMDYGGLYEAVEEAIISNDFREAIATIKLPRHDSKNPDQAFTLSPYWSDALTHLAGFLLNGNPINSSNDEVYIASRIDRMEIVARDLSPDVYYRSYAYIECCEGSNSYLGHVYILHEDSIVGILEGARFQKMPRKTLHHILGDVIIPRATNGHQRGNSPLKDSSKSNDHVQTSENSSSIEHGRPSHSPLRQADSLVTVFLAILLDETKMTESELTSSAYFSEIGVDSLMSISIIAALKAQTGLELGASFLLEHPTLIDAQRALRVIEHQNSADKSGIIIANGKRATEQDVRECNVVLLQGPATSSSGSPLFLIADGGGSAAAYIHLPRIGDNLPVFAVESPWVQDPDRFTSSFGEAAALYMAAICAKQPCGPYLLGGWSGGGVFAYEVARLLLEAGQKVIGLIIIDIPGPRRVDRTNVATPTLDIIDQIGMLTGIERNHSDTSPHAQRLKKHMLSTVICFSNLDPIPMAPGRQPDATFIIWAKKDIIPKPGHGRNGSHASSLDAWFYPLFHKSGPSGWDFLVGNRLECFQVEGDHFSIMAAPEVAQLGKIIQDAVSKCNRLRA